MVVVNSKSPSVLQSKTVAEATALKGTIIFTQSAGFSVAAIPVNRVNSLSPQLTQSLYDGNTRGIVVKVEWQSDSGSVKDLDEVYSSEIVKLKSTNNVPDGFDFTDNNSGYLSLPMSVFNFDQHTVPVTTFDDLVTAKSRGKITLSYEQVQIFYDKRTTAHDVPMTNSGYSIVDVLEMINGLWTVQVTKTGANVTVDGLGYDQETVSSYTSSAGATKPATGIVGTPQGKNKPAQ